MSDIQKLTYPYFTDGTTQLNAANLNPIIQKLNEVIEVVNSGETPTQTVATPTISISGTTATITCSTSGATIYYTLNGNTPTTSSTQYSSPITLSGACTIKAIAVKSGMTNSSVASQSYTPSSSYDSDAQAIMNRYTKSLSTAKKDAFNTFVVTLKTAGIYAKIDYMLLPFLANDVNEAVLNAKDGVTLLSNASSLTLANNGIKPIVGQSVCQTGNIQSDGSNIHLSFYNINSATLISGKWDVALSSTRNINNFGKQLKSNGVGIQFYGSVNGSDRRWSPSELVSAHDTAKTHVIVTGNSSRILMSVNGTQATYDTEVIGAETGNTVYKFGQSGSVSGDVYVETTSESSTFGGASAFNYGLVTIGKALTDAECSTFNTAVNTLMNVILA